MAQPLPENNQTQPESTQTPTFPTHVIVSIPVPEFNERFRKLFSQSRLIRIISLIDVFLTLFTVLSGFPYATLMCLFALTGYIGAKRYNYGLLIVYQLYQLFEIVFRIYLIADGMSVTSSVFTGLAIVVNIYFMYIVQQMIMEIRKFIPGDRDKLYLLESLVPRRFC